MPRLTSIPDFSSRAIRLAMMVWASMASPIGDQIVDDRGRGYDMIGCDHTHRYNVIRGYDNRVRGHGDHRVEIARSQRVGEIAGVIGKKGVHECEIGAQRGFQQIAFAINLEPA